MKIPKHLNQQLIQPHQPQILLTESPQEKAKRQEMFRALVEVEQKLTYTMRQFKEMMNPPERSIQEIALADRTVRALGIPQKLVEKRIQVSEAGWLGMILYPRQFLLRLDRGAI